MKRPAVAIILFLVGAVVSPLGDHMHVVTGTTHYDEDFVPFVWQIPISFVFMVGFATMILGLLRLRLAPPRQGLTIRHAVGAVAGVMFAYAISATVHSSQVAATVMVGAVVALMWAVLGDRPAVWCGVAAGILGPLGEIAASRAGLFHYAAGIDGLFGVAVWLPLLYAGFGMVAACLAEVLATWPDRNHSDPRSGEAAP